MSQSAKISLRAMSIINQADCNVRTLDMPSLLSKCEAFGHITYENMQASHKHIVSSEHSLVSDAVDQISASIIPEKYTSDRRMLRVAQKMVDDYMWQRVNREEGKDFSLRLQSGDEKFIAAFFIGTDRQAPMIFPIASSLAKKFNEGYRDLNISVSETCIMILDIIYAKGTWYPLKKYEGRCSIYSWIGEVCIHQIKKMLEKEGRINTSPTLTEANSCVDFDGQPSDTRRYVIEECVYNPEARRLLTLIYVDMLEPEAVCRVLDIDMAQYEEARDYAERILRKGLLNSPDDYSYLLKPSFSAPEGMDPIDSLYSESAIVDTHSSWFDQLLSDRLGISYYGDAKLYVERVIQKAIASLRLSPFDAYIWEERFYGGTPSKEVAKSLGVMPHVVDQHFCNIRAGLRPVLRSLLELGVDVA